MKYTINLGSNYRFQSKTFDTKEDLETFIEESFATDSDFSDDIVSVIQHTDEENIPCGVSWKVTVEPLEEE